MKRKKSEDKKAKGATRKKRSAEECAGGKRRDGGKKDEGMPPAFSLREGAWEAKGLLREGGVVLLAYRLCLPAFGAKEEGGRAQFARAERTTSEGGRAQFARAEETSAKPGEAAGVPSETAGAVEGVSTRGAARIAAFYARIAKGMWQECEGDLFSRVRRAYEESDDKLKRFRFARFVLSAEWRLVEEGKGSLTVARTLTLSRRGKVLRRAEWREVFSKKSGRLVFPLSERVLSALAPSWRRKNKQKCEQENKQRCKQESKQKEG